MNFCDESGTRLEYSGGARLAALCLVELKECFMKSRSIVLLFGMLVILLTSLASVYADVEGPPDDPGPTPTARPADSDGDGWSDLADTCPYRPGPIFGCPDADGDLIPDWRDDCPTQFANTDNGCPPPPQDYDGDGVLDGQDVCPYQGGPASNFGCPTSIPATATPTLIPSTRIPPTATPIPTDNPDRRDSDGDGWPDGIDNCPAISGTDRGCPGATSTPAEAVGRGYCQGYVTVSSDIPGSADVLIAVRADITFRYLRSSPYDILPESYTAPTIWTPISGSLAASGLSITEAHAEWFDDPTYNKVVGIYVTLEATETSVIRFSTGAVTLTWNLVPLARQTGRVALCGIMLDPNSDRGALFFDLPPNYFG